MTCTHNFEMKNRLVKIITQIIETAIAFVFGRITRFSSQSRNEGPTIRWSRSQFSNRLLLRLNAHSAKMKKTVVGNPGTTIPIVPTPTHAKPKPA